MKKLLVILRYYWVQISLGGLVLAIVGAILTLLYFGFSSFVELESFSRRQFMSMMGIYLVIGIIQAFVFVAFLQMGQYFFMSGGLLGKAKVQKAKANIKWDEVIGMESAKKEAWEIVELLKDRHLLKVIGGKIVKGTLMIGPPGCGKTYLAKAIATECGMPLIATVGSEFVGIYVGQGAAQMKSLFKQARKTAGVEGGCIIFIDEIDSFARHRVSEVGGGGGGISHNATINQFLTELDGLRHKENNIIVIAATNAPEHELDSAIMRAGRFDRKIYITRPNLKERKDLFDFYLSRVQVDESTNSAILARKALWFTPSDIDSMVREAGLIALREKRSIINMKDLSAAYDRVIFGEKSNIVMTDEDKKWTAYHEAGHAILAYLIHPKDDVIKATIIPRRGALGFVSHRPQEEHYSHDREYYLAQIKISVASYVAEDITFGSTSSGVGGGYGSDFYTALTIARDMVWSYGMGKSGIIGEFQYQHPQTYSFISSKTRETLDADVQDILQTCIKEVREILTKHNDLFVYFSEELLKKEDLEYDEIQAIFNKYNLKPLSGRIPLEI